jgi:DNA damage-binding protein 1
MKAYGRIDDDGARHLLSDVAGVLYLLVLERNSAGTVTGLKLEPLGETTAASALCYLDNRVVYVGSSSGNNQLIRLLPIPDSEGRFVEVLESSTALGPIVDLSVVDLDRQGQCQVVTCSGRGKDGSLRVIRNGVGINEQAAVELPGIKGMWSLRAQEADEHDSLLVVTFISETRVLAINAQDELDEIDVPGFDCASQTLLCANTAFGQLLQVTSGAVILTSTSTRQQVAAWHPPTGSTVTVAAADRQQVLLGIGGGRLVYLEAQLGALQEVANQQLEHEISCVDCHRLQGEATASLAVAGLWSNSLLLLELPTLKRVADEKLASDAIPRSVLLATFEGVSYLLAGLGDGQLCTFVVESTSPCQLRDMKKLSMGTQPISLRPFRSKGELHVFAASDRPTVVYSLNHKLLFSNVNLREVNHVCSFNSANFPESLAVASEDMLTMGTIDDIQKLHVRTVPLSEQPRRIAHQESTHTFLVGCMKPSDLGEEPVSSGDTLRLLDDQTFDKFNSHDLEPQEMVFDILSTAFAEGPRHYYVVATAFADPEQPEPVRGRILVFAVEDSRLQLLAERELKAGVFAISSFCGKLVAGVHNKVQLFRWVVGMADDSYSLVPECSLASHIMALTIAVRGEFILVGDLMKSASLIQYKPEAGVMEERARDINSAWTTATECVDDDTFIVAEAAHNLVVLRKNGDAATDEERHRLDVVAEFHLGHQVNAFAHGSLVMRMPDSDLARVTTLLFGTVSGMLGVVVFLPAEQWAFLLRLQQALTVVVHGVGGFTWADWRGFVNERRTAEARNVVDGDLIECVDPPLLVAHARHI